MGAAAPIASGVGSLVGANSGKNAQKAANAAAQQAAQSQGQVVGAEQGVLNGLLQNYFGQGGVGPSSQSLTNTLMGQYGAPSNPFFGNVGQGISALQNYQGLAPEQMNALTNTLGQGGESVINTLRGTSGGVANQNNLFENLLGQNAQGAQNAAIQLGAQGAQNRLGALQSAGGLSASLAGLQNQQQGGILSALEGLFGQGGSLLQSGLGSFGQLANMFGQQGSQAASNAQAIGNPFTSALGGVGNAAGSLGGKNAQRPGSVGPTGAVTSANPMQGQINNAMSGQQQMGLGFQFPQVPSPTSFSQTPSNAQTFGGLGGFTPTPSLNFRTPQGQGMYGGLGGAQNPNTGGFNGLTGSEMTNPGMSYQSRIGALGPQQR